MTKPKLRKQCKTCQGYGMWAFGLYASMGKGDSVNMPTIPCPECGANANPLKVEETNA